jgi:protein-S-isoprenylcysteine O-methyltransferase Ste14
LLPDHTLYVVPAPWRWLLLVVQGAAALGFLFALRQTSMRHFLGIAGESPLQSAEEEPLVTDGAYAYVRHPLYAFGLLWMWCSPVLTVNLLTVNIIFSLYLYIGSWHEEQRLAQQFGAAYRDYQQRVGRFIPRFPRRSSHSRTTAIE